MCNVLNLAFLCQLCVPWLVTAGLRSQREDGYLNYRQLALKYGYNTEEYSVVTEDGYKILLFRIPGRKGIPLLLMHGIMDSSDTWIIRGNTSLAISLASEGYDVWTGNCRGNRHSRRHLHINPNSSRFWDFSFHEHGYYDAPAIIDTILYHSNAAKLNVIAHSQGTTMFFVLCSTRPEYSNKVNLLIGLAPVAFLYNVKQPIRMLIRSAPVINRILKMLNIEEIFAESNTILKTVCATPVVGYIGCVHGLLFPLLGFNSKELEPEFAEVLAGRIPTSTSRKNLYHFAQIGLRKQFAQFDYGVNGNIDKYNSRSPPQYNLSLVTMKVALFVAANDKVSTVRDVEMLTNELPNVVKFLIMPNRTMNHVDFVWGKHMSEYLFPHIFDLLEKFTK